MGFFDNELPQELPDRSETSYGPEPSLIDSFSAGFRSSLLNDNFDSDRQALNAARGERRKKIAALTGKDAYEAIGPYLDRVKQDDLAQAQQDDPWHYMRSPDPLGDPVDVLSQEDRATDMFIADMRQKGTAPDLLSSVELRARARELALDARAKSDVVTAASKGLSSTVARFLGSAGSAAVDPFNLVTAPIGLEAQTVKGAIALNAMLGAGVSVAAQPAVARWQRELGHDVTVGDQARNVALDAVVAGALGGAVKGGAQIFKRIVSAREVVDAFDRAFPDRDQAPRELQERRDVLEVVADIADDNPLPKTQAGEQEHIRRMIATENAINDDAPLPRFPEDVDGQRRFEMLDPATLETDAMTFQYKDGGDAEGVTDRLKGVKTWDPVSAGIIVVYETKAGKRVVADGHQRLGLARRLKSEGQDPRLFGVVLREADGVSPADARVIAAVKNINENSGTAIDAAKIIRARPDMAIDLPPQSALVRDARGLAELDDNAFRMVINKVVPENYAAIVGRMTRDRKDVQGAVMDVLAKNEPSSALEAESMIRDALDAPQVQATMEDLFGTAQETQVLYKERAGVLSGAARALQKDRQAFSTLVKEAERISGAGNRLVSDVNQARVQDADTLLQQLQRLARRKGPVADALAKAAKSISDGKSKSGAIDGFLDDVRKAAEGERGLWDDAGGSGPVEPETPDVAPAPFVRDTDTVDLFLTPDPVEVQQRLVETSEPNDLTALTKANDDLEAELRARLQSGETIDTLAATDDRHATAADMLAEFDADREFIEQIKVCLT